MSDEFALSSLRLLVRRRVEHEKRNSESTSDHVLFCLLSKHSRSLPASKVDFINEWKTEDAPSKKKLDKTKDEKRWNFSKTSNGRKFQFA